MLTVQNVNVYDLIPSVLASGYAMRTDPLEKPLDSYTEDSEEFKKGLIRAKKLINASKNSDVHCHDNFLTGIRVSFDVKYPQYWTPEFQRYHFADIVTSSSKMHRLLKMDIDNSCNKYVTQETKDNLKKYIEEYNTIANMTPSEDWLVNMHMENAKYEKWMKVLSNTPLGLELFMRVSTNYKQLQTIYYQRKNHRLKEWHIFCSFIEHLPYFQELILGQEYDKNFNYIVIDE